MFPSMLTAYAYSFSSALSARHEIDLLTSICRSRPAAIIYHSAVISGESAQVLEAYQEDGGIVITCPTLAHFDCDQVIFDYKNAGYQVAKHLIESGHREIGFHVPALPSSDHSYMGGFRQAMQEHHLEIRDEWIFSAQGKCYEAGGAGVAAEILQSKERPTAVCMEDDVAASACINELMRAGMRVPDEISIVGQDNRPAAQHCIVPLTTVEQPLETLAARVVELVSSRIRKEYQGKPRQIIIQGDLVQRSSVAPVPS